MKKQNVEIERRWLLTKSEFWELANSYTNSKVGSNEDYTADFFKGLIKFRLRKSRDFLNDTSSCTWTIKFGRGLKRKEYEKELSIEKWAKKACLLDQLPFFKHFIYSTYEFNLVGCPYKFEAKMFDKIIVEVEFKTIEEAESFKRFDNYKEITDKSGFKMVKIEYIK